MSFPILYSSNKAGKPQIWSIFVTNYEIHSVISVEYGLISGKKTINDTVISKGKNMGRSNETSHYQQALKEARSKWNKKKDQGYEEQHEQEEERVDCEKVLLPMLALDYHKRGKDIIFPCFVQPKIDGVRAILNDGKLQSRTGKFFPHLNHITDELKECNLILDGELYSNTLGFQDIVGIIRKQTLKPEDFPKLNEIIFVVYDVIIFEDYENRYKQLYNLFQHFKFKFVFLHKTEICESKDKAPLFHQQYVNTGYEGLMLRNYKGSYDLKIRSKNLQKFKAFQDEEFKIVGFREGTGIEAGLVIWICETPDKKKFNVRPQGTHDERKQIYTNANHYIGKYLTVKFFEYTDDNIPRFPVGLCIREYE